MMILPSADGFVTQLQETGTAVATVTPTDDLVISVQRLLALTYSAGLSIRIFVKDKNTLRAEVRP